MRGDNSDRRRRAAGETGCSMCRLRGVLNGALASIGDGDGEESVGGERDGSKRQVDARLPIHNSNTLLAWDPGTPPTPIAASPPPPHSRTLHSAPVGHGAYALATQVVHIPRQLLSAAGARVVRALS